MTYGRVLLKGGDTGAMWFRLPHYLFHPYGRPVRNAQGIYVSVPENDLKDLETYAKEHGAVINNVR